MNLKTGLLEKSHAYAILCFVTLLCGGAQSSEICEATINCPGNYDGDTIRLPDNIAMLSRTFYHCSPTYFNERFTPGDIDTISLFFIIDHSGSMSSTDPNSTRYDVTANIIDSLSTVSGASEVGMAIFSNQLMHNYQIDTYAKRLDSASGWTDSYIPLTRLDGQVKGQSAVDYLKSVIELSSTEIDNGRNFKLVNGYYGKSGRHGGHENLQNILSEYNGTTDISLAFDAARKAFQSALYPKEKQYIIFLSDGKPQNVDLERMSYINDFVTGTNIPTTFTAYWINTLEPIPSQITAMTDGIKANGYSKTNQKSAVWKTSGNAGELTSRLLNVTGGSGFAKIPSTPKQLTINKVTTNHFDDSLAYFDKPFILNQTYTTLDITFTYHYAAPWNVDSTHNYIVVIESKPDVAVPADIPIRCWEQGRIVFFIDGEEVNRTILDDEKTIEVRYYPPSEMPPSHVEITIQNMAGTDQFQLSTINNNTYFYKTFTRENGVAKSDGTVLQNSDNDSIIAIYKNPYIPLDFVREARRVGPARNLAPSRAWYLDQNADGYPDVIKVVQGKDRFLADEAAILKQQMYVTSTGGSRSITITDVVPSSIGFDVILADADSKTARVTSVFTNERLNIRAIPGFSHGGSLAAVAIAIEDSMAPVVVSGLFTPGNLTISGDDTLDVVFSEAVPTVTNQTPLHFYDSQNMRIYSMTLTSLNTDGAKQKFLVTAMSGRDAPGKNDSLWINELAGVGDANGRIQLNPNNHRAPFNRIPNKYTFSIVVCPSPADPQKATIPQTVLQGLNDVTGNTGVVVMVSSNQPVSSLDTVSGTISIYDQLGLPVVKNDRCQFSSSRDKIIYIWNGTNKNGRIVGDGVYVAIVRITVSTGATETLKTKIGVLHD